MWKEQLVKPSPTLFDGAEQELICKYCGPLPIQMFAESNKRLCLECESERRSIKDHKYNHSERRKITDKIREEKAKKELDEFLLDIQK